jgi:hypothetical protein
MHAFGRMVGRNSNLPSGVAHGFTGIVPAACDAEAGEPEEVVLDWTASPHTAPPSAACTWIAENEIPSNIRSGVQ